MKENEVYPEYNEEEQYIYLVPTMLLSRDKQDKSYNFIDLIDLIDDTKSDIVGMISNAKELYLKHPRYKRFEEPSGDNDITYCVKTNDSPTLIVGEGGLRIRIGSKVFKEYGRYYVYEFLAHDGRWDKL